MDQSAALNSSGFIESTIEATTTTISSDEKGADDHQEHKLEQEKSKLPENEVKSSKADDSVAMEALQLTEPDDLYDEYREVSFFF